MDELIKLLDEDLHFDEYEICDDQIYLRVSSNRDRAQCPYCGHMSHNVHSRKVRTLKDVAHPRKEGEAAVGTKEVLLQK